MSIPAAAGAHHVAGSQLSAVSQKIYAEVHGTKKLKTIYAEVHGTINCKP